jgi:hypothetical protein
MRRKIDLVILLIVLILGVFSVLHAQSIGDWWHARTYTPPDEIVQLSNDAGMSDTGKNLFYRFEPSMVDQSTLDQKCSVEKIGCTEDRFIYILRPTNQAEENRTIVTAAHEMLHVAYSRLSQQQKDDLEPLLKAELDKSESNNIKEELNGYSQDDYYNEAHSFIGSEMPDLISQLEQYYAKYFSDRTKTTAAYEASPER